MSSYTYSLGAKCLSEFLGMTLTMLFGLGVVANEMLISTKGHGMGFLAVAIGFGLSFGVNIAWFGFISAHLNPAMFLFLALTGKVTWTEFAACSCSVFAGAFCGAILVFIFYAPHFGFSLPLPSNISDNATLIEGPVSMDTNAGRYASAFGPASRKRQGETLRDEMENFFRLPTDDHFLEAHTSPTQNTDILEKMEMRHKRRVQTTHTGVVAGNNSVNLAVLFHKHDPTLSVTSTVTKVPDNGRHSVHVGPLMHAHDKPLGNGNSNSTKIPETVAESQTNSARTTTDETGYEAVTLSGTGRSGETEDDVEASGDSKDLILDENIHKAYKAALQADAAAKLSVFSTRPAIYNRPWNFLQEAMATCVLVLGAECFNLRREMQEEVTGVESADGPLFQSFYVAMYIALLVLGLGGPTGLAANPFRDLAPRLAHQLLPIPGKGSSEWGYGLVVPGLGGFAGAAVGAAIYTAVEGLYNMVEVEGETSGVEL